MRRKKGRHEEHENMDRWLLTYADMITLLMAFFIMMYSMSVLNLSRFREAAVSIRSGFGGILDSQGTGVVDSSGHSRPKSVPIVGDTAGVPWKVIKPLVRFIENESQDSSMEIGEDNRGIVITLRSDQLLFKPGGPQLDPRAYPVLDRLANVLAQIDNLVQIEGHTCNLQPRGSKYETNWELSTGRATNVLRYMVEKRRLSETRFAAAGYGSIRPVRSNATDAERRLNRRVEIVILRPEVPVGVASSVEPRRISDPTEAVYQRRID